MGIYREMIMHAENGDYQADYALRSLAVEASRRGDYLQMPEEFIAFSRRALLRNLGQTIEQAIEVADSADIRAILTRPPICLK